jgi:hypothetical protein
MGVYYYPNKKKAVEKLLPNFWGADFYGLLHRFAVENKRTTIYDDPMPRIPYSATEDEAKAAAAKIRDAFENRRDELTMYLEENGRLSHLNGEAERQELIKGLTTELIDFLEKCGGYHAD